MKWVKLLFYTEKEKFNLQLIQFFETVWKKIYEMNGDFTFTAKDSC